MKASPSRDLPFPPSTVSYIAESLEIAEIEADRPWLVSTGAESRTRHPGLWFARMSAYYSLPAARAAVPKSMAHWELSPFLAAAIMPAVLDLTQGEVDDYPAFRFLYERLLGERAVDWLPSLYLAAAAVPNIDTVHRVKLIGRFGPEFLGGHS